MIKREADRILRRCYQALADNDLRVRIARLRTNAGEIEGNRITIDFRDEIVLTIIHECLHYFYPGFDENKILKMEKQITQHISGRQAANLIKRLASVL